MLQKIIVDINVMSPTEAPPTEKRKDRFCNFRLTYVDRINLLKKFDLKFIKCGQPVSCDILSMLIQKNNCGKL